MGLPPRVQGHLDHARHNERFLDLLLAEILPRHREYADWALVVMFYTAVHFVNAVLLAEQGVAPTRHLTPPGVTSGPQMGRNELVTLHFDPDTATAYKELYDLSRQTRYRAVFRLPGDALAFVQLHRVHLERVKSACLERLGLPG